MAKHPKVPDTISDREMRDLQRRAQWAERNKDILSREAIARRLAMRAQKDKADQS